MSFDTLSDANWAAVAVAAVAYFLLGAVWYANPFIARLWAEAGGIEVEGQSPNPLSFVGTLVAYFVAGIATAMLAVGTGTSSVGEGAILGLVVGVGYALTAAAVSSIYDRKPDPLGWFLINGVFNTAGLVVVGVIIGAWR